VKWLVRIAAGVALLLLLAIAAALVALPSLLEGEEVRARIRQAARDALGRELTYQTLELGFLPPSLRALDTSVSGEREGDPPLLEAREIALRVALWPLLFRTVVVDSLVVEGATLRLARGARGIELPTPPARGGSDTAPEPAAAGEGGAETEGAVSLAVRSVRLRDTTLHLVDRQVKPAVTWELREIDAEARGDSLDQPIELEARAALASGGRIALEGTATLAGELDLEAQLDDVAVDPLAPYLGPDLELAGRLGGVASVSGAAASPAKLEADLQGRDVRFRRGDVALRGSIDVQAKLADPAGGAAGSFELDATGAELEVGGGFTKPAGTPATVTGRIARASGGGLAFEDVKLLIRNFEATGRVSSLDPLRVELDAKPFELAGWEALVPALAERPPAGRLRLEGLRYRAEPADLRGAIHLDDLTLGGADAQPVALRGVLNAAGTAIASEGLVAVAAGQTIDLDARLEQLFTQPRYRLVAHTQDADSNALLASLFAKPDTLYGPLGLDANLAGALGGDPLRSLTGQLDFGVVEGRLVGVSLLRAVFDRLGGVGGALLDLGKAFGGRDLQRFYGDEFEKIEGVVQIADGVARSDGLSLQYRGYAVRLRGSLALADLALDMRGDLTIDEELDAEVAEELSLKGYQPRQRTIELAEVGGTLSAPTVRVTPEVAARFAAAYAGDTYLDKLRGVVEEEVGEGSGGLVDQGLGVLKDVLGGKPKPP
jgi:uncharacterized protein involved in outer membrane biogenesis